MNYPVSVPMDKREQLAKFLAQLFLQQTILRCQKYLKEGCPDLDRQIHHLMELSFGRDDSVKYMHTFDMDLNAPLIAAHVQLMGGDPCPPVATEKPKKKKKGKKR